MAFAVALPAASIVASWDAARGIFTFDDDDNPQWAEARAAYDALAWNPAPIVQVLKRSRASARRRLRSRVSGLVASLRSAR